MKKTLLLALLLCGCASRPVTQELCVRDGGDMTVFFHKLNEWKCCKIVKVNGNPYCKVVE